MHQDHQKAVSSSGVKPTPSEKDSTGGKLPPEVKIAVDSYRVAYSQVTLRSLSVEQFYQRVKDVNDALLKSTNDKRTVLEALTPQAYSELQSNLVGLVMNRDEAGIIFIDIDPLFFISIARQYGTEPDSRFFEIYRETYPRYYIWAAWDQQQTDYTSCTKYEAHNLVSLWNAWTLYHARFPGYYTDKVTDILELIESELTSNTCACGDKDSVLSELRTLVVQFPDSKIASTVRDRIRRIEEGRSEIRFHCHSG